VRGKSASASPMNIQLDHCDIIGCGFACELPAHPSLYRACHRGVGARGVCTGNPPRNGARDGFVVASIVLNRVRHAVPQIDVRVVVVGWMGVKSVHCDLHNDVRGWRQWRREWRGV
jgi:hypothetical protein